MQHSLAALVLALCLAVGRADATLVLSAGHFDLGAHYDPETGWHAYIWDFEAQKVLDPRTTVLEIGGPYRQTLESNNLGGLADRGETVWVLPNRLGKDLDLAPDDFLYLGMGTQQQPPGVFTGGLSHRGKMSMRLISVEGCGVERRGDFAVWDFVWPDRPEWIFSTRSGIAEEERVAGFHVHYNTGFSAPGRYDVTVEFSGTLRSEHGGGLTSHRVTWTFLVIDEGWRYDPDVGWLHPFGPGLTFRPPDEIWAGPPDMLDAAYVYDLRWQSWIYHDWALYPLAFDGEAGWVSMADAAGRWEFVPGNGWRCEPLPTLAD